MSTPCAVADCPTVATSAGGHCAVHAALAPTRGLLAGDLFALLPTLAANSIDSCVTDPPYGIGFMGREWDTFKPGTGKHHKLMHPRERIRSDNPNIDGRSRSPAMSPSQIEYDFSADGLRGFQSWTAQWAAQVFRVLKPGAYIVVCGAPRSHHRMMCGLEDAGFVVRDCFAWLFGSGFPKNMNLGSGRGTALKPANEPIALAWKPFKGTITANVAAHGTGALNIDACQIDFKSNNDRESALVGGNATSAHAGAVPNIDQTERCSFDQVLGDGRWPANVLIDPAAAAAIDAQTVNVGGASRFYYCAKPSREERDAGCHDLDLQSGNAVTGRKADSPGAIHSARAGVTQAARANTHPTVKPVALMRWLVRLVTPPDGIVLDPFTGSGTTGMAAALEQRRFVGIEKEAEYVAIAERRIGNAAPLFGEPDPPPQVDAVAVAQQGSLYD